MKQYNYVGPDDLLALVCPETCGTLIMSPQDILNWASQHNEVIATFVIHKEGHLCLADRHTEHVACAGGNAVLSAGEMTFFLTGSQIEVTYVTNQSTGYCPEPTSWPAVAKALDKLGISHPNQFSYEFIFRRCMRCQTINIIKDEWYVCAVCGSELSRFWNFQHGNNKVRGTHPTLATEHSFSPKYPKNLHAIYPRFDTLNLARDNLRVVQ
jgi:hypothetical protein